MKSQLNSRGMPVVLIEKNRASTRTDPGIPPLRDREVYKAR